LIVMISSLAALTTLAAFGYFWHRLDYGLMHARTVAFTMLGVNSLFYVFSSRSLRNPIWRVNITRNVWLLVAVFIGFLLQVSVVYVPFLQKIFQTVALNLFEWVVVVLSSILLIAVVEVIKFIYSSRTVAVK